MEDIKERVTEAKSHEVEEFKFDIADEIESDLEEFERCIARLKDSETGKQRLATQIFAKGLHEYLGVKARFNAWFDEMLQMGGYNEDWMSEEEYCATYNRSPSGRRRVSDFVISLRMAREFALLSKTARTRKALEHIERIHWENMQREISRNKLDTFRALVNPSERDWFFALATGTRRDIPYTVLPMLTNAIQKWVDEGKITKDQARTQRIINELIFTEDVMDKLKDGIKIRM